MKIYFIGNLISAFLTSVLFVVSMDGAYRALYFVVGPLVFFVSLCLVSIFLPLILILHNKFNYCVSLFCAFLLGVIVIYIYLYFFSSVKPDLSRISIFYGGAGGGAAVLSLTVNLLIRKWFEHRRLQESIRNP